MELRPDLQNYCAIAHHTLDILLTTSIPEGRYSTTAEGIRRARRLLLQAQRCAYLLASEKGSKPVGRPVKTVQRVIGA